MQQDLFPLLELAVAICIGIWVLILLPMFFFNKKTRPLVGVGLVYSSYVTGFACWILAFIVTYGTLGGFWLAIGVLCVGMGVFPLAVIGAVVRGQWSVIPDLIFAIVTMIVPRVLGQWIVYRHERSVSETAGAMPSEMPANLPTPSDTTSTTESTTKWHPLSAEEKSHLCRQYREAVEAGAVNLNLHPDVEDEE